MYEVIEYFTDLQDFNHPYSAGDVYPRTGLVVSEDRLKELSTAKNRRGIPLIKLIVESEAVEPECVENEVYTKTRINKMSTAELKTLASECGIEDSENLTGGALKKLLIKHFKL